MKNNQTPKARQSGLVVQNTSNELLVYDLDAEKAMCLNETTATVWQACNGQNSIKDISREFEELEAKNSEQIVWIAIDQLARHGLLEDAVQSELSSENRREVLKKIGFASAVAVPVIASLVAPSSVLASASCACAAPGDCLTQPSCPASTCNGSGQCAP
ncbi:MAG: PqqD family peptide modification chaperone [Pyrinomonadaceae bacterium]|nr:PqqD family peptide modification chaperone [Pyrinomonadaceae bacterium]